MLWSAGHGGLVVGRPTAVREDPGSNLTAAGRVYHDSHCDIQPWARVVHPYSHSYYIIIIIKCI